MFRRKIFVDLNFLPILFLFLIITHFNNLVNGIVQIGNCSDGSPAVLPCDQESKICTGNPQMGCERHGPAYFCCGILPNDRNGTANLMQFPSMPSFPNFPSDSQNSQQNCDDKFKQCEHWTRRGLCLMDMYKSETKAKLCPKSCKLCHLVPSKDTGQIGLGAAQGLPQIHPNPPKLPSPNTNGINTNSNEGPQLYSLIKGKIGGVSPVQLPPNPNGLSPNGIVPSNIPKGNLPNQPINPIINKPMPMSSSPPPSTTPKMGLLDSIWNKLTGGNANESANSNPQSSTMPSSTSTNSMRTTTDKLNTVDPSWYDGFDMDEAKKMADGEWDEMDTERLGQKFAEKLESSTLSTTKLASTTMNPPTVDPSWYDGFDMDEAKKMADGEWDEMDTEKLAEKFSNKNSTPPNSMPSTSTSTQMSTMSLPSSNASSDNSPGLFGIGSIWEKLTGKNPSENANSTSTSPPSTTMDPAFYEDDDERLNGKDWDWNLETNQNEANDSTEKPTNSTSTPKSTSPFPILPPKNGDKMKPKKPRKLSPEEGELIHEKNIEEEKNKKRMEENEENGKKRDEKVKRNKKTNEKEKKAKGKKKMDEQKEKEEKRSDEEEGKKKSKRKNKIEEEEEKKEDKRSDKDEGKRKNKRKNRIEKEEEEKEEKRRDEDEDEGKRKSRKKNKTEQEEEYYNDEEDEEEEDEENYSFVEDDYDYEGSYSMEEDKEEEDERNNHWEQFRRGMHGVRDGVKKATKKKNNKNVDWNEFKQKMHSLKNGIGQG